MKKALVTLAALMTAFFMISCQNETTSGNDEDTKDTTAEKVALYNNLVGTSWINKAAGEDNIYGKAFLQTLAFYDDAIELNGTKYSINKYTDLFFYSEFSSDELEQYDIQKGLDVHFIVCLNGTYYTFCDQTFAEGDYRTEVEVQYPFNNDKGWERVYFDLVSDSSSSSDSSSTETVTLSGNYTISQADGSSISFTDGNWSYTYNSSSKSGTYSQSGSELTMNFTMGSYSVSGVFTVSKDGDNIKLTGKSGEYTTIVSSAFMVSDSDALSNGYVTLTAK